MYRDEFIAAVRHRADGDGLVPYDAIVALTAEEWARIRVMVPRAAQKFLAQDLVVARTLTPKIDEAGLAGLRKLILALPATGRPSGS